MLSFCLLLFLGGLFCFFFLKPTVVNENCQMCGQPDNPDQVLLCDTWWEDENREKSRKQFFFPWTFRYFFRFKKNGEVIHTHTTHIYNTKDFFILSIFFFKKSDLEYHTYCLTPPLNHIPSGAWYCPNCEHGKKKKELFCFCGCFCF